MRKLRVYGIIRPMRKTAVKKTKEDWAGRLRRSGFRATPIRENLLALLAAAGEPLTVEKIVKQLKKPAADQATVYRALKDLKDAGVVRRIDLEHSHAHYELVGGSDHHHLVCTACGRIEDFEGCHFEELAKAALRRSKKFAAVNRHSFELFGTCKNCAKSR